MKASKRFGAFVVALCLSITGGINAEAVTFETLHRFTGGPDGRGPFGELVFDGKGQIYGTAVGGSTIGGTIFKLNATTGEFSTIYTFCRDIKTKCAENGGSPRGLTFDGNDAFYGATGLSLAHSFGTIFKFAPKARSVTTLYTFSGNEDGNTYAISNLVFFNGALYGVNIAGGSPSWCTPSNSRCKAQIFKFDLASRKMSVVYAFDDNKSVPKLTFSDGALYGTQASDIFRLELANSKFSVLYTFAGGSEGSLSYSGIISDNDGHFYGTTSNGGDCSLKNSFCGTLFSLLPLRNAIVTRYTSPSAAINVPNVPRQEITTLHAFLGKMDGASPEGRLVLGEGTSLIGATAAGGLNNYGTIFKFDTDTGRLTTLHAFTDGDDGKGPIEGLLHIGSAFYGTTSGMDPTSMKPSLQKPGTIFRIIP